MTSSLPVEILTARLSVLALGALLLLLAIPAAPAQAQVADEVLCPIFIPESPVKYCIEITGNGCVVIRITTFGIPTNPSVHEKSCPP